MESLPNDFSTANLTESTASQGGKSQQSLLPEGLNLSKKTQDDLSRIGSQVSSMGSDVSQYDISKQSILQRAERYLIFFMNTGFLVLSFAFVLNVELFIKGFTNMESRKSFSVSLASEQTQLHQSNVSLMLYAFQTAGDGGGNYLISTSGGRSFSLDTGVGIYNGFVFADQSTLLVGAHQCKDVTEETGLLSFTCSSSSICQEICLIPQGSRILARYAQTFEIEEFYRTKNSLGFGVTYTEQHLESAVFTGSMVHVETKLETRTESNANGDFLYWQDILIWIDSFGLLANLLVRLLCAPIFLTGVQLRARRLFVRSDLAGGLFTSPGVATRTFSFFLLSGMQSFFWLEASGYPQTIMSHIFATTVVCVTACLLTSKFLSGSAYRMRMTGFMAFLICFAARQYTLATSQQAARDEMLGLGQVLVRDCRLVRLDQSGDEALSEMSVPCNIADGMGMSGIEIFLKVYTPTLFLSVGLFAIFELFVTIVVHTTRHKRASRQVQDSSSRRKTMRAKMNFRENFQLSDYEKVSRVSGLGRSVFSRFWAAPLGSKLSSHRWYHTGCLVEDNTILFGPILISLNTYPLFLAMSLVFGKKATVEWVIHWRMYVGVLVNSTQLVSVRENKSKIPDFVASYEYEHMSSLFNAQPIT